MYLTKVTLYPEKYPTRELHPFNQSVLQETRNIAFTTPVTFFLGENGTGKTTILEAMASKCSIHIWRESERVSLDANPYQGLLHRYLSVQWKGSPVAGSFFSSQWFRYFAQNVDEWAAADPQMLQYFGGKSLLSQSHGESLMSYFKARYRVKGLYLLDEPETALSPRSQVDFVQLLHRISGEGHAQFIVATHSPILLACPGAVIHDFNEPPVRPIRYEETEHYRIYKDFLDHRERYFG